MLHICFLFIQKILKIFSLKSDACHIFHILIFIFKYFKDTVLGKINFLLVRIKIKHMELAIIRREASGKEGKSHVLLLIINHLDSKITFENLFSVYSFS